MEAGGEGRVSCWRLWGAWFGIGLFVAWFENVGLSLMHWRRALLYLLRLRAKGPKWFFFNR